MIDLSAEEADTMSIPTAAPSGYVSPGPPTIPSYVRAELGRVADRWEAAGDRARRATTIADRERAEAERREAAGDHHQVEVDLADLLLLLLRMALRHRRAELVALLEDAVEDPLLAPLAEAIARLEVARGE